MTLIRWLTFLLRSMTVTAKCLLFWIYWFLLTLVFVLQWFSLHREIVVVVSVSIDFPSNSKRDASFHTLDYDYSHADWDSLHDYLRDAPREDIFKLSASAAASQFCELVQIGIDVCIPHCKYHVKPHSFPWLSAACTTTIVYGNHFFRLF